LIRSHKQARNDFIHLVQLSDAELKRMAELLTATRQKRPITSVPIILAERIVDAQRSNLNPRFHVRSSEGL
jgi:hypothetical protein